MSGLIIMVFILVIAMRFIKMTKTGDTKSVISKSASEGVGLPPADMKNPPPVLGMQGSKGVPVQVKSEPQTVNRMGEKRSSFASSMVHREPPVSRLMDDREHDWLAGQLRDEKSAKKRMSEMFDLKMEHSRNCEAEMLKQFHSNNCDAEGIDTAGA